ncbi:tyrosine-type recombinase/integrase [Pontibacillus yanchengensis]|nr:tyrosine-type recombinase/integrase [Pontibacillus yanchengensis]
MTSSQTCIQRFIEEYSFRLVPETLSLYENSINQLLTFLAKPFQEVTKSDIRNWLQELGNKYKANTVRTRLSGVKLFYKYCVEEEMMSNDPASSIPLPEVGESLPYYLQNNQLDQVRNLLEGRLEERAIIELLYATGIRIGELGGIEKRDISWEERFIHIRNAKRKKERIVPFTRLCEEHLKAYLDTREDELPFLFVNTTSTGPVLIRTVQSRLGKYAKKLGFRLTPHTLRHTFAAHLATKGMPFECIQALLGHNTPDQSQMYARLYSHARKEKYDEFV